MEISSFRREVLPEFAERDERHVARKAERLAPAIDRRGRKPASDHPGLPVAGVRDPGHPASSRTAKGRTASTPGARRLRREGGAGEDVSRRLAHSATTARSETVVVDRDAVIVEIGLNEAARVR